MASPSPPSPRPCPRSSRVSWSSVTGTAVLVVALLSLPGASAFTFAFNNTIPTTCSDVLVTWQGGKPPFRLLVIPAFDYPSDIALDNSTWDSSSSTGEYVWSANYPSNTQYVAVMSDADGLATGGVSDVMSFRTGGDEKACKMRSSAADFYFYLDPQSGQVPQCSTLKIGWSNNATDPTQVVGVIPKGNAFILPAKDNLWDWTVNIASGTKYILTMLDKGPVGNGGSSDFITVGASTDSSCIDAASPSQTPGSTWGTPDGKAATTAHGASSAIATASHSHSPSNSAVAGNGETALLSTAAIVGIVIGGIIALVAMQIVIFWFCCRTRFRRTLASSPVDLFSQKHEGDVVGAPVISHSESSSGGRNVFGRRTRDLSRYDADPYILAPAGGGPHHDGSSGTLLSGEEGGRSPGLDPFRDEAETASSSYLSANGGGSRRGSSAGMLLASPGSTSPGGYDDSSPTYEGISLRPLTGSSYPALYASEGGEGGLDSRRASAIAASEYGLPHFPTRHQHTDSGSASFLGSVLSGGGATIGHSEQRDSLPGGGAGALGTLGLHRPSPPPSIGGHSAGGASSTAPSVIRQTKAMLAVQNQANDERSEPSYVRHQDAGPMEEEGPSEPQGGVVDLPPLYDDVQRR